MQNRTHEENLWGKVLVAVEQVNFKGEPNWGSLPKCMPVK